MNAKQIIYLISIIYKDIINIYINYNSCRIKLLKKYFYLFFNKVLEI